MLRIPIIAAVAAFVAIGAAPAEAKIRCHEGFQNVSGAQLATPYCQDLYVAQVARTYGIKVSDEAVRNNPSVKRNVCQMIGRDNRVHIACVDANSVGRRGF